MSFAYYPEERNVILLNNVIFSINGPVVTVKDSKDFSMLEMVYVGNKRLIGEVISVNDKITTIQVYESTTGLCPGEPVEPTGAPMSANLGPGILSNIFDGIERPLKKIAEQSGAFISEGSNVPSLDTERQFEVTITAKPGDYLKGGDIYATCPETALILHKCMLSPYLEGEVISVKPNGLYTVNDTVVTIKKPNGETEDLTLCQKWPIRRARPVKERKPITRPLITGQRVIDTLFPIAKGGTAAIPGAGLEPEKQ